VYSSCPPEPPYSGQKALGVAEGEAEGVAVPLAATEGVREGERDLLGEWDGLG